MLDRERRDKGSVISAAIYNRIGMQAAQTTALVNFSKFADADVDTANAKTAAGTA